MRHVRVIYMYMEWKQQVTLIRPENVIKKLRHTLENAGYTRPLQNYLIEWSGLAFTSYKRFCLEIGYHLPIEGFYLS